MTTLLPIQRRATNRIPQASALQALRITPIANITLIAQLLVNFLLLINTWRTQLIRIQILFKSTSLFNKQIASISLIITTTTLRMHLSSKLIWVLISKGHFYNNTLAFRINLVHSILLLHNCCLSMARNWITHHHSHRTHLNLSWIPCSLRILPWKTTILHLIAVITIIIVISIEDD